MARGCRCENSRDQLAAACTGSSAEPGALMASSSRAAAGVPRPAPSRRGAACPRGCQPAGSNLIFSIWPLLSADKKAIKNEKGGGGSLGASRSSDQHGCFGSEFVATRRSEASPGAGTPRVTSVPLQEQSCSWSRRLQSPVPSLCPSPFTHFLHVEIQHLRARENR